MNGQSGEQKHWSDDMIAQNDPIVWFKKWLQAAKEATEKPNVCAFATVTDEHLPSVRMMSLKEVDEFDGFEFFFNFESETGKSVCFKQKASLVFYWAQLDRQVRIDGDVEILGDDENDAYWKLRPRDAQLSAHASAQGRKLENVDELRVRFDKVKEAFEGKDVTRPKDWGGIRVKPTHMIFWRSGGESRLHDRVEFTEASGKWEVARLFP